MAIVSLAWLLASTAASAQTSTGASFSVGADIVSGCAISGSTQTSGIAFGTLNFGTQPAVLAGPIPASVIAGGGGAMQLQCTGGITLQVSVDGGQHANGSQRRLAFNGAGVGHVDYALYTNAGHGTPIPVNSAVAVTIPVSGQLDLPIYGVATLPGGGLPPGPYTDMLQVNFTW
jgi:spore coat protein U-like protein